MSLPRFTARAAVCLLLACRLLGATAVDAAAGQTLGGAAQYKGWELADFRIQGLQKSLAGELGRGLALAGRPGFFGARRPPFFAQTLAEDIQRVSLFLAQRGYPSAAVTPVLTPVGNHRLAVTLQVQPGSPVRVDSVTIDGMPPDLATELGSHAELESKKMLSRGDIFSEPKLARTIRALQDALESAGYPYAEISSEVVGIDSLRLAVNIAARPGLRSVFGDVLVSGVSADLVPLVRQVVDVAPGARYSSAVIRRGQQSLRDLGLFRQVRLGLSEAGPGIVDVQAALLPRKMRTLETSVGYWTDDYLRVRSRWQHRNLLGAGRGLQIRGSASKFTQEAAMVLWWPALFGTRTRSTASLRLLSEREDSYNLLSTELGLTAEYRWSARTTVRAGAVISRVDVDVKTDAIYAFLDEGGLLTVFSLQWQRDSAGDRIYPTRGSVTSLLVEWAPPGFLSENHFVSVNAAGAVYRPLTGSVILASRLDLGVAVPTGTTMDLLPNKRFFAGGASSMRGAKRRKLGPLDDAGAPLGGEARLLGSLELRFPLIWRLRGALFADSGQVWAHRQDFRWQDLEVAAGPGLMVETPVGPIRADLGFNLTDRPAGEPRSVLNVSIGHPF